MAAPYVPIAELAPAQATMTEIESVTVPTSVSANAIVADETAAQVAASATALLVPLSPLMLGGV